MTRQRRSIYEKTNAKAGKFNSVRSAVIHILADGKATQTHFNTLFGDSKVDGEVKITAADTVSGEVNLIDGGNSIKGTFTAKLPKTK